MDNRPIGMFDSGLGGLTALEVFARLRPCENIVYFGDSGRMPYGDKTVPQLMEYARQNLAFMQHHQVKAILVACGTLSSIAMTELKEKAGVPVVGVLEPAVQATVSATRNGKVGIIATAAAIANGAYEAAVRAAGPELEVYPVACPDFAPMVDAGIFHAGDPRVQAAVERNLRVLKEKHVDTLLLGCTHYPALSPAIEVYMGDHVRQISNSGEAARELSALIDAGVIGAAEEKPGKTAFFTSGDAAQFAAGAGDLLGRDIRAELKGIPTFDNSSAF